MEQVSVTDLADGAGRLQLGEDGRAAPPALLVHLDSAAPEEVARATSRLAGELSCVVVGVCERPPAAWLAPLLAQLTTTLGPGDERSLAGSSDDLPLVVDTLERAPVAALTLAHLLRATAALSVPDALVAESLAYSTLLAGAEFRAWRSARPVRLVPDAGEPVRLVRADDVLRVTLARPGRHNAFGRAVRDGLLAGLDVARLDPDVREVVVDGDGPSFCSGGDLDEFGSAPDPASAHVVRLALSAGLAVHALGRRARFVVHGACIGAGVEVPAFAHRVDARDDAVFALPELSLGLVPGAGGTVSLPRRIGRWRTAYLCLTGRRLDVDTALAWGLVDGRA